ncbi:MAG: hypothetical protein GC150_09765 [Rhizobiales bacterium]|nr:hypothetical protein [Hyphomicrobiales bacterium]
MAGAVVLAAMLFAAPATVWAAPGGNGNGNGNSFGYGWYKNNGGGAGAPLPGVALTLLGQVIGVGGLALVYRRRQARKHQSGSSERPH